MGTISNARAYYGLLATGTPTKTQVDGSAQIGVGSTVLTLTGATKAYCVSATLASATNTLTIDTETGIATVGTAPVSQVETATIVAAAGATSSGNLAVTVTAAGVTGSPLAIPVALVTGVDTTASLIGSKVRTALGANTALTALYTVGGSGANITLTRTVAANNDTTLNIAVAAGLGVSAITNSTDTTAGVGGVVLTNNTGDGKDFEGISLGEMQDVYGIIIKVLTGSVSFNHNSGDFESALLDELSLMSSFTPTSSGGTGNFLITSLSAGTATVEVTIFAS